MRLSHLSHETVFHVVCNAQDLEQLYTLNGHRNPFLVTNGIMARSQFAWLAWSGDEPVTVFGAAEVHSGVWSTFLLSTPKFASIALPLSKFAKRTVVPTLFDQLGAHRVEAELHQDNVHIHRWVELLGGQRESVKRGYARDGSDYFLYTLCRPMSVDRPANPG